MKIHSAIAVAMLGFLLGCASRGNTRLIEETNDTVSQKIVIGTSTKNDVKKVFGDPTSISFTDSGNQIWTYSYEHGVATPVSYIPIVGAFVGGANVDKKSLVVLFDNPGVVKNFTMNVTKDEVRRGTTQ